MAWFEGQPRTSPPIYRTVTCGDLWPGELSRMLEIWRSPRFAMKARLRETAAFLARLLNPTIKSDYAFPGDRTLRSEEHTSELQSLMRISYAVFCLQKKQY